MSPYDVPELYDLTVHTKYLVKATRIKDIELASDRVVTIQDLDAIIGDNPRYGGYQMSHTIILRDAVVARLNEIKAELQGNPKKKSFVCETADDLDLSVALQEYGHETYKFCRGLRRVGNKFMWRDPTAKDTRDRNITLWRVLVAAGTAKYKELTGLVLRIDRAVSNRPAALALLRSIVDKPTDAEWRASHKRFRAEKLADVDVVILNQMWDDVESFEFVKPKTAK